jgi:CxxC motif-containing protein (DUF1111 family)
MGRKYHAALTAGALLASVAGGSASCTEENSAPCDDCEAGLQPYPGEELSGGETTVFDITGDAFARAARNLDQEGRNRFALGDHLFNRSWTTAPASAEGNDGLGPTYNAGSCSACHSHDGRGAPPPSPDDGKTFGLLFRLSVPGSDPQGGPLDEPTYGGQLQPLAILGVEPEGRAVVTYQEVAVAYADGETASLRRPTVVFEDLAYGPMASDVMVSPRVGQHMVGLGLLAAIPEADLLAREDAADVDGDGISGRANRVWDVRAGAVRLGRFGWKANQPTLEQQVSGAFNGDMGITSPLFAAENCPPAQEACAAAPSGGAPEIDDSKIASITFYAHHLAVPARRGVDDPTVLEGRTAFEEAGCTSCHVGKQQTGTLAELPELSDQTIWPYTDLLLHDMGPELADGRPDFEADGSEWRTPPLWGVGLIEEVSGHLLLMHDGRARGFAEAILWHGGEAEAAREAFRAMPRERRQALIAFLESL